MPTKRPDRSRRPDLLSRPPAGITDRSGWVALTVDPVAQLNELADLHGRGLLGPEEFELCTETVLSTYR